MNNKPSHCPFCEWDGLKKNEEGKFDRQIYDIENSKCYHPAAFVLVGIPEKFVTPSFFRCPECYTDGGDYLHCDVFSKLWWNKHGGNFAPRTPNNNVHRTPISKAIRHEVFKKSDYKCAECGKTNKESCLHVDHIIPVSQGGSDELVNLQCLCQDCNLAKSNRTFVGGKS